MHSDQIYVDEALARDLIYHQFPRFRGEDVVALESAGTLNAIFRIGSNYAARLPLRMMDPAECTGLLEAEMRASAELNASCPFPSPHPIAMGRPSPAYPLPWLVQTWVEMSRRRMGSAAHPRSRWTLPGS